MLVAGGLRAFERVLTDAASGPTAPHRAPPLICYNISSARSKRASVQRLARLLRRETPEMGRRAQDVDWLRRRIRAREKPADAIRGGAGVSEPETL